MTQLIPQSKIDEAAREHYRKGQLGFEKAADTEHAFHKGVQFALNEIQPLMVEFADYVIAEYDRGQWLTTQQLLEEFIEFKNKQHE